MKNSFLFYIYYLLVLILTLTDVFLLESETFSIYFALATTLIGILLQIFLYHFEKLKREIVNNLNNVPKVEMLHEEEFYSKFKYIIKNAQTNVDITHLSLENPLNGSKTEQKAYYKDFINIVNEKQNVDFRRVERISKDKVIWIETLLSQFNQVHNFSLYCLKEPDNSKFEDLVDLISIQRVDDSHTFLVALLEHKSTIGKRDIYLRNKEVTTFFRTYFQKRLIEKSIPIIRNGNIDTKAWLTIKKALE